MVRGSGWKPVRTVKRMGIDTSTLRSFLILEGPSFLYSLEKSREFFMFSQRKFLPLGMVRSTSNYVFFWGDEPYTNFTPCKIRIGDKTFKSSEQAFMYQKAVFFDDYEMAEKIYAAETPKEAKAFGRLVQHFDEKAWSKVSYRIMEWVLRYKFNQNSWMVGELFGPFGKGYVDKTFVEASPYDRIWGIGYGAASALMHKNNWGENKLGRILTSLKDEYWKEFQETGKTNGFVYEAELAGQIN